VLGWSGTVLGFRFYLLLRYDMDPLAIRVAALFVAATEPQELLSREFPSDAALKKYLQEHPKADKGKHTVKPTKEQKDQARTKEREKEDAEFSQALRQTLKDKGVSEKSVHNWIDKEKTKLHEETPGNYGKKEKAEKAEKEFADDLHEMLRQKGISNEQAKKWVEEEKKKLASFDPSALRVARMGLKVSGPVDPAAFFADDLLSPGR
jgi:hypothetical protein